MRISLLQKEFVSAKLVRKAKVARVLGDAKFWAVKLPGLAVANAGRTVVDTVKHPISYGKGIGKAVKDGYLGGVNFVKDRGKTIFSPKSGATVGLRVTTAVRTGLEVTPGFGSSGSVTTGGVLGLALKGSDIVNLDGKGIIKRVSGWVTNPFKTASDVMKTADASHATRISGTLGAYKHGENLVSAITIGGGGDIANAVVTGPLKPKHILGGIGNVYGERNAPLIQGQLLKLMRTSLMRRFRLAWDRSAETGIVSRLRRVDTGVSNGVKAVENSIDKGWGNVKGWFKKKPNITPLPVPAM